jgi:hypothetical protein
MQLPLLLLAQLVSSVYLPSVLTQAEKFLVPVEKVIAHSNTAATDVLNHSKGSVKTIVREYPTISGDKRAATLSGKKRVYDAIHGSEMASFKSDSPLISKEFNSIEIGRKRKLPQIKNELEPLPKPTLDRQESFTTNFNKDFDMQGDVGACHIFATLEVIHDVTKGLKLSKEKLFLDHLFSLEGVPQASIEPILELNINEIERVRKIRGKGRCFDSIDWEGGLLIL